ncbi:DNA-binding SARP family transcriptional activator [Actinocrispum wychmicini]|uniref:DNA-binding SARP family transcriptional activator n=1 Tax=Actinocrispum wychmicini TaxID=1213861 RepID=A0A4R2IJL5_9PSEU|nr:DNA-binding SARP family transcriptional activator [Actinocrispum wychmicini]
MKFRLLGPFEIEAAGPVWIPRRRERCLLAVLLLEQGRMVAADRLADLLWDGQPPSTVRTLLRSHVSRLRGAIGSDDVVIDWQTSGYVLHTDPATIDAHVFRTMVGKARELTEPDDKAKVLRAALRLWRGPVLADIATGWISDRLGARLEELRREALDQRISADLAAGRHRELIGELTELLAGRPGQERFAAHLMVALYRSGRQGDALAVYDDSRRILAGELGLSPGAELRRLHERILRADPVLDLPEQVDTRRHARGHLPAQLPGSPQSFAGRADELATLDERMRPGTSVVVLAICGAGGIGKTWLALAWAHRHVERFPDGQLFVDLHGFSPAGPPKTPTVAIRAFLDALGVEPHRIPPELDGQAALYRSLVADKRMLIVLDNAASTDQVTPLLPGGSRCTVLVTSRDRLAGLTIRHGAHSLRLDALSDDESHAVLRNRLGPTRVTAEARAVAELVDSCAGFPLALGLIAGRAHSLPQLPLAEFAAELRESRMNALADADPAASLPSVLSHSCRALTDEQRLVFALLGIAPGPDIGLPAAASLVGLSPTRARAALRALESASLLNQQAHDRYSMHDLVRQYATTVAHRDLTEETREAGLRRILDFYTYTAYTADRLLAPHRESIDVVPAGTHHPLADLPTALAWLTTEHSNLLAGQHIAATRGWHGVVSDLAWALTTFHTRRGDRQHRLAVWQAALDAAAHLPDPVARIFAHRYLGLAFADLGHHEDAIGHLRQALALAEQHPNRIHQAQTYHALVWTWGRSGDYPQAMNHATRALKLLRGLDQPAWEAIALNDAGWCAARSGDYDTARAHLPGRPGPVPAPQPHRCGRRPGQPRLHRPAHRPPRSSRPPLPAGADPVPRPRQHLLRRQHSRPSWPRPRRPRRTRSCRSGVAGSA